MPRLLLALAFALALSSGAARADDLHWPKDAEARFQEALQLSLKGKHVEAAAIYRTVADWPDGGDWKERPRALYSAAAELETARDFEHALETYRELLRRFPRSDFTAIANRAVDKLAPAGVSGGLDFQRKQQEAWDVLQPAMSRHARREYDAARPGLEKALSLLEALLRDHREHPKAVDVAVAQSDVLLRLGRIDQGWAAAEDAVSLAERETAKPGASTAAQGDLLNARRQLGEAQRAVWCRRLVRASTVFLAALAVFFAVARPWRRLTRRLVKLWLALVAFDGVLAAAAVGGAEYVRRRELPDSILTDTAAAVLVLVPGAVGITVGLLVAISGRRGAALAAVAGFLAALAAAMCLVQYLGLSNAFLPGL